MTFKEMIHLMNRYFTRGCGIILCLSGCYLLYVAFAYIDDTVIKIAAVCIAVFALIVGGKYLHESKKGCGKD